MIRKAEISDLKVIQNLNVQIFDVEIEQCNPAGWNANYPYEDSGLEYINNAINEKENYSAFVYTKQNKVIAYMILYLVPEKETKHRTDVKVAQLHTFCVDKNFCGKGIGQLMMKFFRSWAKENKATHIKVVAMAQNERARKIYRDFGFQEFEVSYEMPA